MATIYNYTYSTVDLFINGITPIYHLNDCNEIVTSVNHF